MGGGGLSGLKFQKGAFWKIWTKIYCLRNVYRNVLCITDSLSHTTYVETNDCREAKGTRKQDQARSYANMTHWKVNSNIFAVCIFPPFSQPHWRGSSFYRKCNLRYCFENKFTAATTKHKVTNNTTLLYSWPVIDQQTTSLPWTCWNLLWLTVPGHLIWPLFEGRIHFHDSLTLLLWDSQKVSPGKCLTVTSVHILLVVKSDISGWVGGQVVFGKFQSTSHSLYLILLLAFNSVVVTVNRRLQSS